MTLKFKTVKFCYCKRSVLLFLIIAQMLILSGVSVSAGMELPPLHEAESMVGNGPEVFAAISAMERDSQLKELERQRMGARYFVSTTFGYSDEPLFETSEESASYSKLGVGAGLVFPLFGTWNRQKVNALESEIKSIESNFRPIVIRKHNLTALRKAYVTLWSECEKIAMAKRFLSTEEETYKILSEREKTGLLLMADRLEFMTAYDIVRRDVAASVLRKTQALQIIRLATGQIWEMPERMEIPTLPRFDSLEADIENHPEIVWRKEAIKKYEALLAEKRVINRDGSLTIGVTAAKDFPGEIGSGAYASLTISEPLGTAFSKDDKANIAAAKELERARRDELFSRIKMQGEAEETISLAAYADANIKAQESRLLALTEAVRERILRHASISGDTFEQLQKSRYQYYRGAIDLLDSEMIFMQTGADLLGYAYPGGCPSGPSGRIKPISDDPMRDRLLDPDWLLSPKDVSAAPSLRKALAGNIPQSRGHEADAKNYPTGTKAVYVWDASPFLAPETRSESLRKLQSEGFCHLLISFTSEQLKQMDVYYKKIELEDFLSAAERTGIRADLLLGDPEWLYPEKRKDLLRLILKMKNFNFKGIHLDIEPDSLLGAEGKRGELLSHLTDTVREALKISDKPLSLSIHPRYLEGDHADGSKQLLNYSGLEYVAVMIYTTNPDAAASRMKNILLNYPDLKFFLAQSVERALPIEESYFSSGIESFGQNMDRIGKELSNNKNYKGIIIQAWEDFGGMVK
jgi:outer membrane protein TolC